MEKKNNEKTAAELYREERKKRLEKAAKKNARSAPEFSRFKKVAGKVIAFVLVAAIILGCVYGILSFFGVPQRVLSAATIGDGKTKDEKLSVAKFNYYYISTYTSVYNQAKEYESYYGEGYGKIATGYDISLAPDRQEYTATKLEGFEEGETAYWSDALRLSALDYLHAEEAVYLEAVNAGYKLTDDQKAEIDESIESAREKAKESDYSLNRFLIMNFGKGVNEKLLREIFETHAVGQKYLEDKAKELQAAQTDEDIEKEFKANKKDYALVTFRAFTVNANPELNDDMSDEERTAATDKALKEAKKTADAILETITSEETFIAADKANAGEDKTVTDTSSLMDGTTYSAIQSAYGTNTADWAYDNARKVGDTAVIQGSDKYIIAYMVKVPYKNEVHPANVRHILFKFEMDENNQVTSTEEEKAALKKEAQRVLDEFNKKPSEDAFIELVSQYSQDSGSVQTGGLIENITADSSYVENFKNWAINPERKVGDAELIETEFGYHIMYFSGYSENAVWYNNVRDALADKAYQTFQEDILAKHPLKKNEKIIAWAVNALNKHIGTYLVSR